MMHEPLERAGCRERRAAVEDLVDHALLSREVRERVDRARAVDAVVFQHGIAAAVERQRAGAPLDAGRGADAGRAERAAGELEERQVGRVGVGIDHGRVGQQPDRFAVAVGEPLDENAGFEVAGGGEPLEDVDDQAAARAAAFAPVAAERVVHDKRLRRTGQCRSGRERKRVASQIAEHVVESLGCRVDWRWVETAFVLQRRPD